MNVNYLIDKRDAVEKAEQLRTVQVPGCAEMLVKYKDVLEMLQDVQPAIYKISAEDARKLNEISGTKKAPWNPGRKISAGTIEVRVEVDTEDAMNNVHELSEAIEDLTPRIRVSTVRDCQITVNVYQNGR